MAGRSNSPRAGANTATGRRLSQGREAAQDELIGIVGMKILAAWPRPTRADSCPGAGATQGRMGWRMEEPGLAGGTTRLGLGARPGAASPKNKRGEAEVDARGPQETPDPGPKVVGGPRPRRVRGREGRPREVGGHGRSRVARL